MNIKSLRKIFILLSIVFFFGTLSAGGATTGKEQPVILELAADVLTDSISISGVGIPKSVFREAFGVAIFPNIINADLSSDNRQAEGVAIMRTEQGEWSGPVFIKLGLDNPAEWTGAGASDIVFVFKTEKLLDNLRKGELNIGKSEEMAGGLNSRAQTETAGRSGDIYAYKRTGTVFKEFQVREANIFFDTDANAKYYKVSRISPDDIFMGNVPSEPIYGNPLTCLMASFSGTTQLCLLS